VNPTARRGFKISVLGNVLLVATCGICLSAAWTAFLGFQFFRAIEFFS
jgi:hypothetical protein